MREFIRYYDDFGELLGEEEWREDDCCYGYRTGGAISALCGGCCGCLHMQAIYYGLTAVYTSSPAA